MKTSLPLLFLTASFLVTPLHAELRSWTNVEGTTIEAELVKAEGGNVTLKLRNGKLSTFPQSKLSFADQDFLKSAPAPAAAATPSAEEPKAAVVDAKRKAKWLTKMDKAQEESKATGLPILVLFTGTSWCPYCIKLEKEVFAESAFKTFADQNLVLLKLEYGPGGTAGNKKDEKLKQEFAVSGFPTYFLTDSAGAKQGQGGYHAGIDPTAFAGWVKQSAAKK